VASLIWVLCALVHASARQASVPRVVDGRVVLGDDNPVRRAHVVATGGITVETDSDPDGVFHLNNLPAGRYAIAASKPGFVQEQPAVIDVAGGAGVAAIKVQMTRAGAIAGRLIDQTGKILADSVVVLRSGAARLEQLTDDRGVFRFHTLRDGPYSVWAAGEEQTTAHDVTVLSGRTEDVQIVATAPNVVPDSGADTPEPPFDQVPAGTHVIRGRVVSAETGAPLAAIVIRVSGVQQSIPTVRTSASGRYVVPVSAAGNYAVSASGPPKYPTLVYGQTDLSSPPGLVVIAPNQSIADVNFELPETKTLAGRVVDEFGDPAPNVTVVTVQPIVAAGKMRFLPFDAARGMSAGTVSNDLGEFRLRNVPPGTCFLMALSGPFANIGGGPSGPQARGYGYAPTFFPGTPIPGDAKAIVIATKGIPDPVLFRMAAAGMGTVTGRILDPSGAPIGPADVMLMQLHSGDLRMLVPARLTADRNGVFSLENVPAGSYVAQTLAAGFASEILAVSSGQTTAVELHPYPPSAIRGRFVFDGGGGDADLLQKIRIRATNIDFVRGPAGGVVPPSAIHDDGSFEVTNLIGLNVLVVDVPAPWMLLSVSRGGADMTDRPFDAAAGDAHGVIIRFAPHTTTLSGVVTDSNGQPLPSGFVLIVPQDSARWAYPSRAVRGITGGGNGSFSTTGLPPGAYRAVPFERMPRMDWMTPDFLQTIQGLGEAFTIGAGESISVRLQFRK
jgi:hypothetical protein